MASKIQDRPMADLKVDESLDPRTGQRSQERIDLYAESVEHLPPILVDSQNRILDGIHRYLAHQQVGKDTIRV